MKKIKLVSSITHWIILATLLPFALLLIFGSDSVVQFVFWAYLTVGAIVTLMGIRQAYNSFLSPSYKKENFGTIITNEKLKTEDRSIVLKIRDYISFALSLVVSFVSWPLLWLHGFVYAFMSDDGKQNLSHLTARHIPSYIQIVSVDRSIAILFIFIILSIAAVSFFIAPPSVYAKYIIAICLFCISLRHLEYIIGPSPILQRVRISIWDPAIVFFQLLFIDAVGLVIGYHLIFNWETFATTDFSSLRNISEAIFLNSYEVVKEIWKKPETLELFHQNYAKWLPALSGTLISLTLVKGLLNFLGGDNNQFKREDSDYLSLAGNLARIGYYREAYEMVDRAKPDANQLVIKSAISLGLNRMDEAYDRMEKAYKDLKANINKDSIALDILSFFFMLGYDDKVKSNFINELPQRGVSDGVSSHILWNLGERNPHTGQVDVSDFANIMTEDRALTKATGLFLNTKPDEALKILNDFESSVTFESALKALLLLRINLLFSTKSEEDVKQLIDTYGKDLEDNAKTIKHAHEIAILLSRMVFHEVFTEKLFPNNKEYFYGLRDYLLNQLPPNQKYKMIVALLETDKKHHAKLLDAELEAA